MNMHCKNHSSTLARTHTSLGISVALTAACTLRPRNKNCGMRVAAGHSTRQGKPRHMCYSFNRSKNSVKTTLSHISLKARMYVGAVDPIALARCEGYADNVSVMMDGKSWLGTSIVRATCSTKCSRPHSTSCTLPTPLQANAPGQRIDLGLKTAADAAQAFRSCFVFQNLLRFRL